MRYTLYILVGIPILIIFYLCVWKIIKEFFKKMPDADPEKVEYEIKKRKLYLQAGMYAKDCEGIPEYYLMVYDNTGNFSVIKIDYSYISYGIREYNYLLAKFDQCVKQNRWTESFNFFDHSQRTSYKPKWLKGFETDPIELEN